MSGKDLVSALQSKILAEVSGKTSSGEPAAENQAPASDSGQGRSPAKRRSIPRGPAKVPESGVVRDPRRGPAPRQQFADRHRDGSSGADPSGRRRFGDEETQQRQTGFAQQSAPSWQRNDSDVPAQPANNGWRTMASDSRPGASSGSAVGQRYDSRRGPPPGQYQQRGDFGRDVGRAQGYGQRYRRNDGVSKPFQGSRFNAGRGSEPRNRFQGGYNDSYGGRHDHAANQNINYSAGSGPMKDWRPRKDVDWSQIAALEERHLPEGKHSKFGVTPEGFEKVPAERAKLSGLFPLPGQPQTVDQTLLQDVVSKGFLNRRTRILFEDTTYINLTELRMNKTLVVTPMELGFDRHENFVSCIANFLKDLDYDVEVPNRITSWRAHSGRLILELNKESLVTIVLTCQKILEQIIESQFVWQRPSEYVNNTSGEDPLLSETAMGILKLGGSCMDEASTAEWLAAAGVECEWMQTLRLREQGQWLSALVYGPKPHSGKAPMTIHPNQCERRLDFKQITYQTLPDLVRADERRPSKVICLLNCVDPMDLKNDRFVTEVREAMTQSTPIRSCGEVESVRIPLPNPDYRNDMSHIHSSIGKIYVKFKELISAERAMLTLPGAQFCQRTIVCSYFSEKDYDLDLL